MFKTTKGAFLRSLETAAKFTRKGKYMSVLKHLKIDGKNGTVTATDLETLAICPFKCEHSQQVDVDERKTPDFIREDLAELTVKQLAELVGPEAKGKKKDELIEFIQKFQSENPLISEHITYISDEFLVDLGLVKIVKALPMKNEDEITIKILSYSDGTAKSIMFNDFKEVYVNTMRPDDFPEIINIKFPDYVCEISGKDALKVAKACSTDNDDKRVHVKSVYLDAKKGLMCGTDGRRLHTKNIEMCGNTDLLIPVDPMRKIAALSEEKIMIGVSNNFTKVIADGNIFIIMLNAGYYPNFADFVKTENHSIAEFDTTQLIQSLKQAVSMESEGYTGVEFDIKNNEASVKYMNPERGELEIEGIHCSIGMGIKAHFCVNPTYVLDAMNIGDEKSSIFVKDWESPVIVSYGDFRNIVMPLR